MASKLPIPEGKYLTLKSGLRIHYVEAGKPSPDKPMVLCIHGGGPGASGYSNYKKNMPAFAAAGYYAVAPDLPGFGLSDKPDDIDYISTLHVQAMAELVESLGVRSVVPIGNSLGGSVALEFALTYPKLLAGLILMAPGGLADPKSFWGQTDGGMALAKYARERPEGEAAFREVLSLLVHDNATISDDVVAERYPVAQSQPSRVFTSVSIQPTWERLEEITKPVLCFWGSKDRFLPVSQTLIAAERFPNCKVVISNRAGHWYMLEQPDDFNREAVDFLVSQVR